MAISISLSAKNGILVKNAEALEVGEKVDSFVFDKTGTITKGIFMVTDVETVKGFDGDKLLTFAASLERNSEHPIGLALVRSAEAKSLHLFEGEKFEAKAGQGVKGVVQGRNVLAGTLRLMEMEGMMVDPAVVEKATKLHNEGRTLSYVALDGDVYGVIGFADELKPSAVDAIRDLHNMGKEVVMITGDNRKTAEVIATKAGVDQYLAEVLPEDKAKEIKKLQDEGKSVAMVGDGINDAPALVQANVGIAIGAGTDIAIESADVVLIKSDPADVSRLVKLSKATMRKMRQNLFWATAYNTAVLPIAAGVLAPFNILLRPEYAAIIMSISSIIVVVNALLLRREKL
jgi:heavy metal translocating P-type ATPase